MEKSGNPIHQLTTDTADYTGVSVVTLPNGSDQIVASLMSISSQLNCSA
ncbi:MAG: hypothetical protein IPP51_08495 [Bacteroidetes bacterium]|nr:hypothetical protein [Bacteroidota bacterium]